jgi:hypothetical protein
MDPDKTFCLKWNDFQQNIFSTIRNLRLDLDFLDVTIFCSGTQVKAHKVILSACSTTFKAILKEAPSPHPIIVLWDVEAKDLSAILDFMYNGQVDIRQEDLESFLAAAGKLQVQGLTGEVNGGGGGGHKEQEPERKAARKRSVDPESKVRSMKPTKLGRKEDTAVVKPSSAEENMIVHDVNAHRELVIHDVSIKEEVETEVKTVAPKPAHSNATEPDPERRVAEADYSAEAVDYPDEYADEREDYYEDESSFTSVQYPLDYSCPGLDSSPGKSTKSVKCPYCEKVLKYRHNLKGHIQNQHGEGEPEAPCPICPDKTFKNAASLRDHMSRKHSNKPPAVGPVAVKGPGSSPGAPLPPQGPPQGTLAHS